MLSIVHSGHVMHFIKPNRVIGIIIHGYLYPFKFVSECSIKYSFLFSFYNAIVELRYVIFLFLYSTKYFQKVV